MNSTAGFERSPCSKTRHPARRALAAVLAGAAIMLALTGSADDWPQWRGPRRTGVSQETGWLHQWPPELVWTQYVGEGYSGAAVSDGRVYTSGYSNGQDIVWCLDAETGRVIWSRIYACGTVDYNGTRATPTVHQDRVYAYSHEGKLYCYDSLSGIPIWNKEVNYGRGWYGLASSPLIEGDLVIVAAGGAGAAVRRTPPYALAWRSGGYARYASPVVFTSNAQRWLAIFSRSGVYVVNPLNGQTNGWYAWTSTYNTADPIVYGDKLFITERGEIDTCALLQVGVGPMSNVWENYDLRCECSNPVLLGDYLYGFDYGDLVCMDIRDGTVAWREPSLFPDEGSMIAADGKLIVQSRQGDLNVVKADSGAYDAEGRTATPVVPDAANQEWLTPPALANGMIFCRSREGTLACLRVGTGPGSAVEGSVAYSGSTTGAVLVKVFKDASFDREAGSAALGSLGAYSIANLYSGVYYVAATIVTGGDTNRVKATDPWGAYTATGNVTAVTVPLTQTVAGVDFQLFDAATWNPLTTIITRNDVDADGRSDAAVYFPPGGNWYISRSKLGFTTNQFGYAGTVPITGDFDGDGRGDYGVYYAPGGNWYIMRSKLGFTVNQFGYVGTIPFTGDFDGDGRCDYGVYYAPGGNWYIMRSKLGFTVNQFGYAGTVPFTGDFDGDGRCDYGVYFAPGGNWYIMRSKLGFTSTQFGYTGTVPVTGDFDGDGRDDFGVYYAPGGNWYVMRSSLGFTTFSFGYTGTIPVGTTQTTP